MNKTITISILSILLIAGAYALYSGMTKDEALTFAMNNFAEESSDRNAMDLIIASSNLQSENMALRREINRLENKPERSCGRCQPQTCPTCESCPVYQKGDINQDGFLNVLDCLEIRNLDLNC